MNSLQERIRDAMKAAMKGGDKKRLAVIRLIMAAVKQREVDERIVLDEQQMIEVLDRMLKQRRESIRQYRDAGREDLAEIEEAEILVIQEFLPQLLHDDEIAGMIREAIDQTGAASVRDMGKVMGLLKPKMEGRADMSVVSGMIKKILAG